MWELNILILSLFQSPGFAQIPEGPPPGTPRAEIREIDKFFYSSGKGYKHGLGIAESGTSISLGTVDLEPLDSQGEVRRVLHKDLLRKEFGQELKVRFSLTPWLLRNTTLDELEREATAAHPDRVDTALWNTTIQEGLARGGARIYDDAFGSGAGHLFMTWEYGKGRVHHGLPTRDGLSQYDLMRVSVDRVSKMNDSAGTAMAGGTLTWLSSDGKETRFDLGAKFFHDRPPHYDSEDFLKQQLTMSNDDWKNYKQFWEIDSQSFDATASNLDFDITLAAVNHRGRWGEQLAAQYNVDRLRRTRLYAHAGHLDQSGPDQNGYSLVAAHDFPLDMMATSIFTVYAGMEKLKNSFEPVVDPNQNLTHFDQIIGFKCKFKGSKFECEFGPEYAWKDYSGSSNPGDEGVLSFAFSGCLRW